MPRVQTERGSATIEAVAGAVAFAAFSGLIMFGGQIALAHQAVQAAATDAARAASLARTVGAARGAAEAAAHRGLTNHGLGCTSVAVSIDTAGFAVPVGQPAWVAATVRCDLASRDLGVPVPFGTVVVETTMRSPLDTFRPRT